MIAEGTERKGGGVEIRSLPIGWCAVAPREDYPRLERSRILKPVDEASVWSITCFFIARTHRGQGL
ncbi:MAG TPA: hypothetical protein VM737_06485, partial [Gemmatimonadota bacterium]|nr:hypothetical protein [Gemmatimonadota bacterium]